MSDYMGIFQRCCGRSQHSGFVLAGMAIQTLALRLLKPLPEDQFQNALQGVKRIVVVEQNQHGQLFHYLNSLDLLPEGSRFIGAFWTAAHQAW